MKTFEMALVCERFHTVTVAWLYSFTNISIVCYRYISSTIHQYLDQRDNITVNIGLSHSTPWILFKSLKLRSRKAF